MQHRFIAIACLIACLAGVCLPAQGGPITLYEPGFTEIPVAVLGDPTNNFGSVIDDGAGNLYATNRFNPNAVRITGGVVTPLGSLTGTPLSVQLVGSTLFVGTASGQLFTYDTTLALPPAVSFGSVTGVGVSSAHGMALAPASFGSFGGDLIVAGISGIAVVDPVTAVVTSLASGSIFSAVAFTPGGNLLAAAYAGHAILEVTAGGVISTFAALPGYPGAIAVHPVTGDVYVAIENFGSILKFDSTGTVSSTFASSIIWDSGHFPTMMAFSQDGGTLYFGEVPAHLPTHSLRGITGFPTIAAVPEPSSLALLALGGIGLVHIRRRRARTTA